VKNLERFLLEEGNRNFLHKKKRAKAEREQQ
jgi:hypothetical protein